MKTSRKRKPGQREAGAPAPSAGRPGRSSAPEALTKAQALAAVPVRNEAVETSLSESGATQLTYPLAHRPWAIKVANFLNRPVPGPASKTLELDELGAWTWERIDGQRSVAALSEEFAAAWRLHPREAELSITAFLKELGKRGLVLIVSPQA